MITVHSAQWDNLEHTSMTVVFSNDCYKDIPYGICLLYKDKSPIYNEIVTMYKDGKFTPSEYAAPKISEHDLACSIRNKRDTLLKLTDKYMTIDFPISDSKKDEIKRYRQHLRDLTAQGGFPVTVQWPSVPDIIKDAINSSYS